MEKLREQLTHTKQNEDLHLFLVTLWNGQKASHVEFISLENFEHLRTWVHLTDGREEIAFSLQCQPSAETDPFRHMLAIAQRLVENLDQYSFQNSR